MPITTYTYEGLLFLDSHKNTGITPTEWLITNNKKLENIKHSVGFEVVDSTYFLGENLSYTGPCLYFSLSINTRELDPIYEYLSLLQPLGIQSTLFVAIWTSMSTGQTFGDISFIGDYSDDLSKKMVTKLKKELKLKSILDESLPVEEDYSDEW